MDPKDTTNQTGATTPPVAPPTNAVPPAQPQAVQPPVGMPQMPPAKKNVKKLILTSVFSFVAFAVFIAALIIVPRFQTVALETYSNSKFSFLAPKDYQKTEDGDSSVTFEENDDDEGTKSFIEAYREDFPEKADEAQQKQALELMESNFKQSIEDSAKSENNTVEDYKATDTTFKGDKARTLTATIKNKGNTAGRIKVVVGVNETSFYVIAVSAHQSDRGVTNSMDKIIDSFEIK